MKSDKVNIIMKRQKGSPDIFKYSREILNRKESNKVIQSFRDFKTQNSEGYSKIKSILYFLPIYPKMWIVIFGICDFGIRNKSFPNFNITPLKHLMLLITLQDLNCTLTESGITIMCYK